MDFILAKVIPYFKNAIKIRNAPGGGCAHFRVLYTRRAWGGRLLRRRECRHCGRRVTTYEAANG